MVIEVYAKDFARTAAALYQPGGFTLSAIPCSAKVEISGKLEDSDYNILRDRLGTSLTSDQLPTKLDQELAALAREADEEIGLLALQSADAARARVKQFESAAAAAVNRFQVEVRKRFDASWNKFVEDEKKYRTYEIKIAIDITVAGVSLAGSVASLAASATPAAPATAILGAYGILKNLTKLIVVIRNAAIEAETVGKELEKDSKSLKVKLDQLAKLAEEAEEKDEQVEKGKKANDQEVDKLEDEIAKEKDLKKKAEKQKKLLKAKEKAKEFVVSFLNKISGDAVGVKVTTIEGFASKAGLYENKCRGVQEQTRAIAREYLGMTEKMLEMGLYCDKLEQHFINHATTLGFSKAARAEVIKLSTKIQTARKTWGELQTAVKTLNDDVEASENRYQENMTRATDFKKTAVKAQEAFKTKNWAEAGRWLGVAADVALTAGAQGASNWAGSDKAVATSLKLVTIFEKEAITELKKKL